MSQSDLFSQMDESPKEPVDKINTGVQAQKTKRGRISLSDPYDSQILLDINSMDLNKQYYGIGEVAEMFHVNTSLIRYWENEFDILKPRKNRKGDRLFRPEDIRHLQLIYHLLRERKFTIEGVKKKLREEKKTTQQHFEMVQSLQKIRKFLMELKEQL